MIGRPEPESYFLFSLDVGYAILATSSLSFLGLGAQAAATEWGALITDGRS